MAEALTKSQAKKNIKEAMKLLAESRDFFEGQFMEAEEKDNEDKMEECSFIVQFMEK